MSFKVEFFHEKPLKNVSGWKQKVFLMISVRFAFHTLFIVEFLLCFVSLLLTIPST